MEREGGEGVPLRSTQTYILFRFVWNGREKGNGTKVYNIGNGWDCELFIVVLSRKLAK